MNEKQTRCPKCLTVYKVSLTQLTVAQGMVCCPKCNLNFNALTNLVNVGRPETVNSSALAHGSMQTRYMTHSHVLDIFDQKVENSNIDLLTYLNNLNYFHNEPINALPNLNLAEQATSPEQDNGKKHSWLYYTLWSSANLILILVFTFQILWFNPKLMQQSPAISHAFNYVCQILHCNKSAEQYQLLYIEKVKLRKIGTEHTQLSGVLINQNNKSIELPNLKLSFGKETDQEEIIFTPQQYLVENLRGIQRIPTNTPFRFQVELNKSKKSLVNYRLEIVHP
ncbi:zinc-ribbon and DUF3426 domain-containing protein [Acinetobacter baumannii]